ncbi:MAG: hypothetical protein KF744_09260 [Taibaiella sp.]|nr:hypothetical protein [Taibaiella sp.]
MTSGKLNRRANRNAGEGMDLTSFVIGVGVGLMSGILGMMAAMYGLGVIKY